MPYYGLIKLRKPPINAILPYDQDKVMAILAVNDDENDDFLYYELTPRKPYQLFDLDARKEINFTFEISSSNWRGPYLLIHEFDNYETNGYTVEIEKQRVIEWPSQRNTSAITISSSNIPLFDQRNFRWSHAQHVTLLKHYPNQVEVVLYDLMLGSAPNSAPRHGLIVMDQIPTSGSVNDVQINSSLGPKILYSSPRVAHFLDVNSMQMISWYANPRPGLTGQSNLHFSFNIVHQGQNYNYSSATHVFKPTHLSNSGRYLVLQLTNTTVANDPLVCCTLDFQTSTVISTQLVGTSVVYFNSKDEQIILDIPGVYRLQLSPTAQILDTIPNAGLANVTYQISTDNADQLLIWRLVNQTIEMHYINFKTRLVLHRTVMLDPWPAALQIYMSPSGLIYLQGENNKLLEVFYVGPIDLGIVEYANDEQLAAFQDMRLAGDQYSFNKLPAEMQEQVIQNLFTKLEL